MKESIVILTGGGPAPGMNTVVGTIAKTFISKGYRVIGLHGGYSAVFSSQPRYCDIDFILADTIFNRGGSYLMMSRYKPSQEDFDNNFNLEFFEKNNVKLLVTVGGDDTASTANRIAAFLRDKKYPIQNIHVPKTIDNDLPLPNNQPTFGFNSAKAQGTFVATTIYEDARTSGNWFVVSAMGRSAGHLAIGISSACHYPMCIIPEMFNKTDLTIDKVVNMCVSAILKRNIMGVPYGAIMVSEGIFHVLSSEELKKTGVTFSYDDHGHPELGKVSKAQVLNTALENKLKSLGMKVKSRPVEIGYDVRCHTPVAFDLTYCSSLAYGVWRLFEAKETGCMVYVDNNGDASPLYLVDLQDKETKKIPPRLVDVDRQEVQNIVKYEMHYITESDYEAAKAYVENPAEYDFYKILNW